MALDRMDLQLADLDHRWVGSTAWWPLPSRVEAVGGSLRWEAGRGRSPRTPRGVALLERFARLADATDEEVSGFAAEWGLLLYQPAVREGCAPGCSACEAARDGREERHAVPLHGAEPVWLWRALAADVAQVLKVAALVGQDRPVPAAEWERFSLQYVSVEGQGYRCETSAEPPSTLPAWAGTTGEARRLKHLQTFWPVRPGLVGVVDLSSAGEVLVNFVSDLIGWRPPTVVVSWQADGAQMDIRPVGLLSAVALQLASTLSKRAGVALCSGCGAIYTPSRKPAAGRRSFCGTCQEAKVPQKLADHDRRRRARS